MLPMPMIGIEYLNKIGGQLRGKLSKLARPLLKDGIGDKMDKGNLWLVPGFTIFAFAILWTAKLSKVALDESTCKGASIYDFAGLSIDDEAKRHCQTANRYYVGVNEPFSYEQRWRAERQVKNPEWVIWFWAPIVFVMYVLTRFIWSLLLENQGINFPNIVNACQSVIVDNAGVTEIDFDKLYDRVPIISDNFRCASSSHAFAAFIAFEFTLVLAPLFLLIFFLPLMIGSNYRTWGLDIAKAWWEHREWRDSPLMPFFGSDSREVRVPLIPRITYCDYHFVTLGNDHILTYRCYLDANWHERTALFTWIMLVFLIFINLCNLYFWVQWAFLMRMRNRRQMWVLKKWLNGDEYSPSDRDFMAHFAAQFKMSNLLLFYYIEAHTDRVVASAFCTALFQRWLEKDQQVKDSFIINNMDDASKNEQGQIGWVMEPTENAAAPPTAPFATPASTPNVYASADSTSPPPLSSEPSSSVGLGYSSASTAKLQDEMKRAQAAGAAENQPETPRTRYVPTLNRPPYGHRGPFFSSNLKRHPYLSEIEPLQKTKDRRRLDKERNRSWKEEDRGSSGDGMKWRCTLM